MGRHERGWLADVRGNALEMNKESDMTDSETDYRLDSKPRLCLPYRTHVSECASRRYGGALEQRCAACRSRRPAHRPCALADPIFVFASRATDCRSPVPHISDSKGMRV